MRNKKILVVTGTRAEFGLLQWIMKEIELSQKMDLYVCATGMHLSEEYGSTYKTIEEAGFKIDKKIDILLSSDNPIGISKTVALGIISFSEYFDELNPDLMIVLGDRYEILSASVAATFSRVPIAHIHGGETTEGLIDEPIRHSITKMSHFHFPSTETYRKRIIQLGENPQNVFLTGAPGLDNLEKLHLLAKEELEEQLNFKFEGRVALVTYHPVTLEEGSAENQIKSLNQALGYFKDLKIIFTMPNADTDGKIIKYEIERYLAKDPKKGKLFKSLGQLKYLSALQYVDVVIGNSSSGLIEVPSFHIPTINIGDRQKNRISGETVIHCKPDKDSIVEAIKKSFDEDYRKKCTIEKNPYGEPGASKKIVSILETLNFNKSIIKKKFFDL